MKGFPIDLASVDWLYIAELCALVLFSTLIGTLALMFAAVLIFWSYYSGNSYFGLIGQFAELLRSCSCNISPACCGVCVALAAGLQMRPPPSFTRASQSSPNSLLVVLAGRTS